MQLGIICAMEEELNEILANTQLKKITHITKANINYFEYKFNQHTIIVALSGIGKVNAAITTQILINNFNIDAILNVGVAGSLTTDLGFGDIVIATDLVQHDIDVTSFNLPLGQIPRLDTFSFIADTNINQLLHKIAFNNYQVVMGRIISGDQFIDNNARAQFLHQEFNAIACEMEGAAIAHVCYLNQIPFAVIRSLSDMAGQSGCAVNTFDELKFLAAKNAAQITYHLLERL